MKKLKTYQCTSTDKDEDFDRKIILSSRNGRDPIFQVEIRTSDPKLMNAIKEGSVIHIFLEQ